MRRHTACNCRSDRLGLHRDRGRAINAQEQRPCSHSGHVGAASLGTAQRYVAAQPATLPELWVPHASRGWLQKEHSSALSRQGWQARLWVCYRNTSKTLPLPGSLVAACGTFLATIVRCVGASSLAATRLWSYCWCAVCGWLCLQLLLSALWPTFRVPSMLFLRSWSSTRPMLVCKKRARVCCNLWRATVRMTPWRVALRVEAVALTLVSWRSRQSCRNRRHQRHPVHCGRYTPSQCGACATNVLRRPVEPGCEEWCVLGRVPDAKCPVLDELPYGCVIAEENQNRVLSLPGFIDDLVAAVKRHCESPSLVLVWCGALETLAFGNGTIH